MFILHIHLLYLPYVFRRHNHHHRENLCASCLKPDIVTKLLTMVSLGVMS